MGGPSTDPLAGLVLSDNDRSLLERWTRMARPPAPTPAPAPAPSPAQSTSPPTGPVSKSTGPPLQPAGSIPGPASQPVCPPPGHAPQPSGPPGPVPAPLQTAPSTSLLASKSLVPTGGLPGSNAPEVLPYFPSGPPPPDPGGAPPSTSESPDVNLVTQQLSKSQVRRETKAQDTLIWVLAGGFGLSMLGEMMQQRQPHLLEPAHSLLMKRLWEIDFAWKVSGLETAPIPLH